MDDSGPPCKRCSERNLSCVLNKSLQTLIEERSKWKDTVGGDLEHMHVALQGVLSRLSLPSLPPLLTASGNGPLTSLHEPSVDQDERGPSRDNSPRLSPKTHELPHVPIESLYEITRLRALRSDDAAENTQRGSRKGSDQTVSDFISNGLISLEDAERLVNLYLERIDHFMYAIGGGKYRDIQSLRCGSPILTACICTVAALHDPASNHLYGVCSREFRRLMAASMFDRRIDRDHLRAMCIGAYWLHDMSWTLSGYAIRRATEVNLSNSYQRAMNDGNEEAMDCMRIWYILYICDHHLSILYGRPPLIREDASIARWEELMKIPAFTEADKRLVSQMALLILMSNVRELFGADNGEPVPRAFVAHLSNFSRQIDLWMGYWSTELLKLHEFIGEFPTKGAILHHYLAKLHLHSHVFRGLQGRQVPSHFQENAAAAVSAATSVVELVLTDPDIRNGLVGIPHYIQSMISFACVFLLKVTAIYSGQYIAEAVVLDLTSKIVEQFRSTGVSKWHLSHQIASGLEKMAASRMKPSAIAPAATPDGGQTGLYFSNEPSNTLPPPLHTESAFGGGLMLNGFDEDFSLSTTPFLHFDSGSFDMSFSGFGL